MISKSFAKLLPSIQSNRTRKMNFESSYMVVGNYTFIICKPKVELHEYQTDSKVKPMNIHTNTHTFPKQIINNFCLLLKKQKIDRKQQPTGYRDIFELL